MWHEQECNRFSFVAVAWQVLQPCCQILSALLLVYLSVYRACSG